MTAPEKKAFSCEQICEQGDKLASQGNFPMAVQFYTRAIQSDPEYATAWLRRAECYLSGRFFPKALADAERALTADDGLHRAQYVAGMACTAMQLYSRALQYLQAVPQSEAEIFPQAQKAIESCQTLELQAVKGEYNMGDVILRKQAGQHARCAEYVGPVELAMAADPAAGRVMVAARTVAPGELLFVARPQAITAPGREMMSLEELARALCMAAEACPREKAVIYAMPDGTHVSASSVPPIDLFRHHADLPEAWHPPQESPKEMYAHMQRIVAAKYANMARVGALYVLPCFINHSCAPSAACLTVGQMMVARAARALQPGDEVSIKYYDVLCPWRERAARALKFGYTCRCPRCQLDTSPEVKAANVQLYERIQQMQLAAARPTSGAGKKGKKAAAKAAGSRAADVASTVGWYEEQLQALQTAERVSAQEAASCRASALPVYTEHLENLPADSEERLQIRKKIVEAVEQAEPFSLLHCKHALQAAEEAKGRRDQGATGAVDHEKEAQEYCRRVHRMRFGVTDEKDLAEVMALTKKAIQAGDEMDFCAFD